MHRKQQQGSANTCNGDNLISMIKKGTWMKQHLPQLLRGPTKLISGWSSFTFLGKVHQITRFNTIPFLALILVSLTSIHSQFETCMNESILKSLHLSHCEIRPFSSIKLSVNGAMFHELACFRSNR